MSIREISKRTGLSRNTLRRYLHGGTAEPKLRVPDQRSKLADFADKLVPWLRTGATNSQFDFKRIKDLLVLNFAKLLFGALPDVR